MLETNDLPDSSSLHRKQINYKTSYSNSVVFFSGRAIKHVKESIFSSEAGARRGVPKVLVVLTDGRSQDDVNKVSKEMQMDGGLFFFKSNLLSHKKKTC